MFKKTLSLVLALVLTFSLVGCTKPSTESTDPVTPVEPVPEATGYELALVTDVGTIDDKSFNQGAWEGLKKYADEKQITYKYYQPKEGTTAAYIETIGLAIEGGAKAVVAPGFLFEQAVYECQETYPDVKFILLDGKPNDGAQPTPNFKTASNTYSVLYAEEQSGFLAGYASVKEGYRKLGFMGGMAVPAVIRFGYGFAQGAEYAAKELALKEGDVSLQFTYLNGFGPAPEHQTLAATWYQGGTEIIFACAGGAGNSVMAAAEQAGKKVIGVDVDQNGESEVVVTSAVKMLGNSVYQALEAFYAGSFPGGKDVVLDAKVDGVGLPMSTSKFANFKQADYDAIYKAIVDDKDGIASSIVKDDGADSAAKLPLSLVKLQVIE